MLLGMCIFVVAIFVLQVRYERSVLRAKEATRKEDCFVLRNAIQQYALDKGVAPKSIDDLVQSKYLLSAASALAGKESMSASTCGDGSEDYVDPVETIPGFRQLYSYSPRETGTGLRSEE
jgi:hypothetical protein